MAGVNANRPATRPCGAPFWYDLLKNLLKLRPSSKNETGPTVPRR
jgi:hypothetical protein